MIKSTGYCGFFFLVFAFFAEIGTAFPQMNGCGCPNETPVSMITPDQVVGKSYVGITDPGKIKATLMYRHSSGDTYFSNDSKTTSESIKDFSTDFSALTIGYGLPFSMSAEAEVSYYLNKTEHVYQIGTSTQEYQSHGLSNLTLSLRKNLLDGTHNPFEWTAGLGLRVPLSEADSILPQTVQTSTGSYAVSLQSYLHIRTQLANFRFYLINRFEASGKNSMNIRYGNSFHTSAIVYWLPLDFCFASLELRHVYKDRDLYGAEYNSNSGSNTVSLGLQAGIVTLGSLNISLGADLPVYRYYLGKQIGYNHSAGLTAAYRF